ncbi:hypothetical protein ELQ92_13615 [Labedella populi]|uniref:Uncharacterized protein n=1 Tax=Labedella populi TaxID=2498850 RepID=A0A444Q5Z9_9MICO|nr:hypothetical protein [Labedella populi]RWZ59288.1 hypothetical protein ELQ92_13615 [Labedella populi]
MRCITYAGENVITSDDAAATLVELTAALAKRGHAEAVRLPIVLEDSGAHEWAELVIGVGNDVLSIPHPWESGDVDFSEETVELRRQLDSVRPARVAEIVVGGDGPRTGFDGEEDVDRFFDLDITFDDGTRR